MKRIGAGFIMATANLVVNSVVKKELTTEGIVNLSLSAIVCGIIPML